MIFVEEVSGATALQYNIDQYKPKNKCTIYKRYNKFKNAMTLPKMKALLNGCKDILVYEYPCIHNIKQKPKSFFRGVDFAQDKVLHNTIAEELGLNVPSSVIVNSFQELKTFNTKKKRWFIKSNTHTIPTQEYTKENVESFSTARFPLVVQEYIDVDYELGLQMVALNGNYGILSTECSLCKIFDDESGPKVGDSVCCIDWNVNTSKVNSMIPNLKQVIQKYNICGHFDIDFVVDKKGNLWFMEFLIGRFGVTATYANIQGLKCSYVDLIHTLYERDLTEKDIKHKARYTLSSGMFTYAGMAAYPDKAIKFTVPKHKGLSIQMESYLDEGVFHSFYAATRLAYIINSGNDFKQLVNYNKSIIDSVVIPYKFYRKKLSDIEKFVKKNPLSK